MALLDECDIRVRAISDASPLGNDSDDTVGLMRLMGQVQPLWDAMTIRILRFAPELTPPVSEKPLWFSLVDHIQSKRIRRIRRIRRRLPQIP
jgi:hypothetical protein